MQYLCNKEYFVIKKKKKKQYSVSADYKME